VLLLQTLWPRDGYVALSLAADLETRLTTRSAPGREGGVEERCHTVRIAFVSVHALFVDGYST
jgi:hypothetical protein